MELALDILYLSFLLLLIITIEFSIKKQLPPYPKDAVILTIS